MVPFGGWEMPLEYGGTIAEHLACRAGAVMFDVSHLGTVRLTGPEAFEVLQVAFTNDLNKIGPGRAQYTHLLDDDGSVLDDIIVWWHPGRRSGVRCDAERLEHHSRHRCDRGHRHHGRPSRDRRAGPRRSPTRRHRLPRGRGSRTLQGRASAPGTAPPWSLPEPATPASPASRSPCRPTPPRRCGRRSPAPISSPLVWVLATRCGSRRACRCTVTNSDPGSPRCRQGWHGSSPSTSRRFVAVRRCSTNVLEDCTAGCSASPRLGVDLRATGCAVFAGDVEVGSVSSGNYSPVLEHGIALAFLDPTVAVGDDIEVDVRGSRLAGSVVKLPFV